MLKSILQTIIPESLLELNRERKWSQIKQEWERNGKPMPVPHIIKQLAIQHYLKQQKVNIFIETGTFAGDMVFAVRKLFNSIISIELDEKLHARATERFKKHPNITIYKGDSAQVLPEIVKNITEPCFFWLDGHFSGGITAKSDKETPIMEEIKQIHLHYQKYKVDHIILIDDARCFNGTGDYPKLIDFEKYVKQLFIGYDFSVEDDIIRIVKKL
jgi:hypothetical protein